MSVFDALDQPTQRPRAAGGSIFDSLESGGVLDTAPKKAGYFESIGEIPGQLSKLLPAAVTPYGINTRLLRDQALDIASAEDGDIQAAKRLRARQIVAGGVGALFPGGEALASRAVLGAAGGGAGAAAEAAAAGQPVLPAAIVGAGFGAVLNPLLGAGGDVLARRAGAKAAEVVAGAAAEAAPSARLSTFADDFGALPEAKISAVVANAEHPIPGAQTLAQELQGRTALAPEPNVIGSVGVESATPPPPVNPEHLIGGMPGFQPIPRVPTGSEQLDLLAPTQTRIEEVLGPAIGKPPKGPSPQFTPSGKAAEIERFPSFKPPDPIATGSLTQAERAAVETSPQVTAIHRGLFAEIGRHPTLRERDARLAFATEALGRPVTSLRKITSQERLVLMDRLRGMRKMAQSVPETRAFTAADDMIERRVASLPPGRLGEVVGGLNEARHRALTAVSSRLRLFGKAGSEIADRAEAANAVGDRRMSNDILDLERAFKGMSEKDRILVGEVMQGAPTTRPEIRSTASKVASLLRGYAVEAENKGLPVYNATTGRASAFQPIEGYFPRIHTRESIARYAKPSEVKAVRSQLERIPPRYRGGGVQFARTADVPGWERDPLKALPIYIRRTAHRLAVADQFGVRDEIATNLLNQVRAEAGDEAARRASAIWTSFAAPARREFSGLLQPLRDAASVAMLTTSGLLQPGQLANTIAREGFLNTVRATARIIRSPQAREAAQRTGATVGSVLADISPSGKGIAPAWAKIIGLTHLDRANRLVSAVASQLRARQVADALVKGRRDPGLLIDAKRFGFDAEQVASAGGLTPEQLSLAAQRGANSTQFASRFLDLPEWRDSEIGSMLYLFKTFTLQQGRFTKDLVKDAKAGHWAPLLRFLGAVGTLNVGLGEIVRSFKGDEPPDDLKWRLLEDVAYTVSLGTFQDAIRSASSGRDALLRYLAGPVASEATQIGAEAVQAAQGNTDPLTQHALQRTVRRVPFVGQGLYDELSP